MRAAKSRLLLLILLALAAAPQLVAGLRADGPRVPWRRGLQGSLGAKAAVEVFPGVEKCADALGIRPGWGLKQLGAKLESFSEDYEAAAGDGTKQDHLADQAIDLIWNKASSEVKNLAEEEKVTKMEELFKTLDDNEHFVKAAVGRYLQKSKESSSGDPNVKVNMKEVPANIALRIPELLREAGFRPDETLVAFDFDLTVKAPVRADTSSEAVASFGLRGGNRLGLLAELEELAAAGVEAIIVTAALPEKESWSAYDSIANDAKKIGVSDLMGQSFGAGPPEGIPHMQSETGEFQRPELWVGNYVTDGKEDIFFQAGNGLVLAGYNKAAAIEHYIYYYGKRAQIKHIVFVDDAVSNAFTVAMHFKMKLNDNAFLGESQAKDSARPTKSALRRVDSIWWSTRGLLLDTADGKSVVYDTDAVSEDSTDNSYQNTEQYNMFRERVRGNSLFG